MGRPARSTALGPLLAAPRYEVMALPGTPDRVSELPAGATVAIACSPTRGQDVTIDLACDLAARGFRVVPHLAARRIASWSHLEDIVDRLGRVGVDDVFCVAGDGNDIRGPYGTGLALLEAIATAGHPFADVGVPGYPEGHHHVDTATLDAMLLAKQPLATYVTTQVCFDADAIRAWCERIRSQGVALPVVAGVAGVVDTARLLRLSLRCGIGDSVRFLRGNRLTALRLLAARRYRPDGLVRRLAALDGDALLSGVHLYTFNETGPTAAWVARTRQRAAPSRRPHVPGTPHRSRPAPATRRRPVRTGRGGEP